MNRPPREPFTIKEAAEELGISESLTRALVNRAELKAYKYGQRKTVVYREDLEAFRESRRIAPTPTEEAG